jgi:hypothetical protein
MTVAWCGVGCLMAVLVFTHAPPMGCGLRVLQTVHVKNGCAWLNHSGRDEERCERGPLCPQGECGVGRSCERGSDDSAFESTGDSFVGADSKYREPSWPPF